MMGLAVFANAQGSAQNVFALLYATSSNGVANVRSAPNANATKVGEIHGSLYGLGDGILLKEGSWHKVIASNGKVGYCNSRIHEKSTWYNGGRQALVAKEGCPVYTEDFSGEGLESKAPLCRLQKGTIIADNYKDKDDYYVLPSAHTDLYIPHKFCTVKNLW